MAASGMVAHSQIAGAFEYVASFLADLLYRRTYRLARSNSIT